MVTIIIYYYQFTDFFTLFPNPVMISSNAAANVLFLVFVIKK